MKIGILTQPLRNNYGGTLQNYALQTILKRMGHDVWTIDRVSKMYFYRKAASIAKGMLLKSLNQQQKIRTWQTGREKEIIGQYTRQFVKENIKTTHEIISMKGMHSLSEHRFDAYIVGSDQVWRPKYSPCLPNYFLDFVEYDHSVKKIAYAASFGVDNWEFTPSQTMMGKKLIQQFDAVSVREDSAVKLCKQNFDSNAVHVLDPTLLLSKEDYVALVNKKSAPHSEGNLFAYILDRTENKKNLVKKIAVAKNLTPFEVMPKKAFHELAYSRDIEKCVFPSMEQWLRAFIDAEFVITDSFHGTIFSIIFEKPFITIANMKRGLSRFNSLLDTFGVKRRMILFEGRNDENIETDKIEFDNINKILKERQIESENFLFTYLNK